MIPQTLLDLPAWKHLHRVLADAHGYVDALAKASGADQPQDRAQLAKQVLNNTVGLINAVAADWQAVDRAAYGQRLEGWGKQARAVEAGLIMMDTVGLFKPRSLKRTRRALALAVEGLQQFHDTMPKPRARVVKRRAPKTRADLGLKRA